MDEESKKYADDTKEQLRTIRLDANDAAAMLDEKLTMLIAQNNDQMNALKNYHIWMILCTVALIIGLGG